jgi:hypothetical protein
MVNQSVQRVCPCCSGTNLRPGGLPIYVPLYPGARLEFKPEGNWLTTHSLQARACLDCGHVALFMNEASIQKLRDE